MNFLELFTLNTPILHCHVLKITSLRRTNFFILCALELKKTLIVFFALIQIMLHYFSLLSVSHKLHCTLFFSHQNKSHKFYLICIFYKKS